MKALAVVIGSAFTLMSGSLLRADDPKVDLNKLPPPAKGKMDYVKDIRPIFERSCMPCHDSNRRGIGGFFKVRLRLDVDRDAAMESEGAIVPGKSDKSRLIHYVAWLENPMPPSEKDRLSSEEIGRLRAWIDQGAVWPKPHHKLPEGHRLINHFVREEFPTEGGEKIWATFVERYEKLSGLKPSLLVSEKKAKMFLGGGLWEEPVFQWRPFIPKNTPKVRVFIPDIVAAKVEVRIRDIKEKDGWKLVWSYTESASSVLTPEFEVGYDGYPVLEVRVISNKNLIVGVSNIMVLAPTGPSKK